MENFLELHFVGAYIPLDAFDPRLEEPFPLIINMYGNPDLKAETIDSFEVGYSAVLNGGRTHLDANFYITEIHDTGVVLHDGTQFIDVTCGSNSR